MVKTTPTTPPQAKKGPPTAKKSPEKSKKHVPAAPRANKLGIVGPTLSVIYFGEPFEFELYMFEKSATQDGFTNGIKEQIEGKATKDDEALLKLNITAEWKRREPNSDNVIMKNDNGYERKLYVRWIPTPTNEKGDSTPETRAEGLRVLKEFLLNKEYSKFVPKEITVRDLTNWEDDNPMCMDNYMLNAEIDYVINECMMDKDKCAGFKEAFPTCAMRLWQSQYVSDLARQMGF